MKSSSDLWWKYNCIFVANKKNKYWNCTDLHPQVVICAGQATTYALKFLQIFVRQRDKIFWAYRPIQQIWRIVKTFCSNKYRKITDVTSIIRIVLSIVRTWVTFFNKNFIRPYLISNKSNKTIFGCKKRTLYPLTESKNRNLAYFYLSDKNIKPD